MPIGLPTRWLAAITAALCAAVFAGAALADGPAGRVIKPSIAVDPSTQCIDSPEVMRRTHMDMLRHERDRTVRQGIRGEKVSLNGCIECHAGPGAGAAAGSAIGSPQAFCESCHRYAAVTLDCFECHQPRPAGAQPARAQAAPDPRTRAAQAAQAFLATTLRPAAAGAQR